MRDHGADAALAVVGQSVAADELESAVLEFKAPDQSVKKTYTVLADAAVCFANADGGTVVLGVADAARTREGALVGVPDVYTPEGVRGAIFERTRPNLMVFVDERIIDGARVLVIDVPPGVTPCSTSGGSATRRLGNRCLPFTADQQRELLIARGQLDWSAQPSGVGPEALSRLELGRLRDRLAAAGKEELAEQDDRRLLTSLRLLTPDGGATHACLLLLGRDEALADVVPMHGYSFQYRPTGGSEATTRVREQRPVLAALERILDLIEAHAVIQPLNISGGVQLQLVDYPVAAVREIVANAFLHRSYETNGTVDVEQSPEWLVVTSPGGFLPGVTPDNVLTHPSTPRNRLLAEVFAVLQLAERTGQGIDRAFREMLRVGKQPPSFTDMGLRVRAAVRGGLGDEAFARFTATLSARAGRDVEILLALSLFCSTPSVDATRLAGVVQRPAPESQDVLARMAALHLVEATRRTASKPFPTYRLAPATLSGLGEAVAYRRRAPSQAHADGKVVEHVREYGFVTNRTLQRMFDVSVYGARDLLTGLRRRGVLQKIDDAKGGRGVRYGPGANFPGFPPGR